MAENTLVCPECGVPMKGIDPKAHALVHWPEYLDPAKSSKLARNRQEQTLNGGVSVVEYQNSHKEG